MDDTSAYTSAERVDLKVDFVEKDAVKALGARWDPALRTWYAPAGVDLEPFESWLPDGLLLWQAEDEDVIAELTAARPPVPGLESPRASHTDGADAWSAAATEIRARDSDRTGIPLSKLLSQVKAAISRGIPGPTWIRAETHGIRGPYGGGQYYIELAEYSEGRRDEPTASATAIVWASDNSILKRFHEETGSPLGGDMELLLLVDVDLYAPKGTISLYVRDIDPSYTLGAMARRLNEIRETLRSDGSYDLNRSLEEPHEFCRVAVISPAESAGLGDFRTEANALSGAGLCEFVYHPAPFEGDEAPGAILASVASVVAEHADEAYDALIIIRGGGATRDLAWLNELRLASAICHSPIPVLCGIGHERDSTIVDEVALRSFDTPSKVAQHIMRTIRDNALEAVNATRRITQGSRALVSIGRERIHAREESVRTRSRSIVQNNRWTLSAMTEGLSVRARSVIRTMETAVTAERMAISHGALGLLGSTSESTTEMRSRIASVAPSLTRRASDDLRRLAQIVLGHSPERTLRRGFALVRTPGGAAVTSAETATGMKTLELIFHDGDVEVKEARRINRAQGDKR